MNCKFYIFFTNSKIFQSIYYNSWSNNRKKVRSIIPSIIDLVFN